MLELYTKESTLMGKLGTSCTWAAGLGIGLQLYEINQDAYPVLHYTYEEKIRLGLSP
jgi:hypothetical protein